MKLDKTLLKTLLELPGIPGREEKVIELLINQIKTNNLELIQDNLGSTFGIKKSSNPDAKTLLIDTHMDEVGFMVTDISKEGFISFEEMGGVWNSILNTQRLRVWNDDFTESYPGVVLWPDTNTHAQTGKTPKIEKMLLDIGVENEFEIKKLGIKKGSVITFDTKTEFTEKRVISKAVDNRVGISIAIEVMKYIKDKNFDYNIIIGSSSQEEIGLVGARSSAYKFNPDIAIVIDVSPAVDFPTGTEPNGILGKGTMLRFKDARTIYSKQIIEYLRTLIKSGKIKYQDYFSKGGTNAGVISTSREGVRVIPLGIVARNIHTGSSVFDINDYNETLKLIELILNDINSLKIVKFK